jgi:hypothetical protein
MSYTNTKMWKGNFSVVTPTTILISDVKGEVSSQNMLSIVRMNILLYKVSKLCCCLHFKRKLYFFNFLLKYKQKKIHNIKFMISVVCTMIYSHLVRICFALQKYSMVFVSKGGIWKEKNLLPFPEFDPQIFQLTTEPWLQLWAFS